MRRLSILIASLVASACAPDEPAVARPNVVLVVVDTLRADRLSAYGYERPTSPWLDARAADGALFRDATAQSGWTLPSMASLFSGRYLTAYRESVPDDATSLAEAFAAAGYRTVGVAANMSLGEPSGIPRGFESYDLRWGEGPEGVTPDPDERFPRTIDELERDLWTVLDPVLDRGSDEPLFLFLHPFDPHDPYFEHGELDAALPIDGATASLPDGWQRKELERLALEPLDEDPTWDRSFGVIERNRGKYDQEVRHTDRVLERIFGGLADRGVLDDAVVAFVSDHGEGLWDHLAHRRHEDMAELPAHRLFYQRHGSQLYQEAIHTPFLLWGSRVPSGVVVDDAVENVDLYPTLLELSDVAPRGTLHGRSLVPYLRGSAPPERSTVHSFLHHQICVREIESGLKLVVPTDVEREWTPPAELYHLPSDPHERHDLSAERPDDVARLMRAIDDWRERHPMRDEFEGRDPRQAELLNDLGYTEADIGR